MKILALECSAGPASVAIIEDEKVLGSFSINVKTTHSQTLMPMAESLLKTLNLTLCDIDGIAIAAGPGSFTGIRIGISAVKGLAFADDIPTVGVSTLYAMAHNFKNNNAIICPVMDARCNQVYNALFRIKDGCIERLCEDRAILCAELKSELENYNENVIICGDGADLFSKYTADMKNIKIANEPIKYQNAVGVALAAIKDFIDKNTLPAKELLPIYLRLPQAERELKEKAEEKK